MADRYVILTCSSFGEQVGDELFDSAEDARRIAESMAEDASTADIPETYSVHKLSEALWEG